MVKKELFKKLDTRAVKPERCVQSGCEAERYPRSGTGGSPARFFAKFYIILLKFCCKYGIFTYDVFLMYPMLIVSKAGSLRECSFG